MLIELPDGNWIDPSYIRMVEVLEEIPEKPSMLKGILTEMGHPPRVCIHIGLIKSDNCDRRVIHYKTREDAIKARDEIIQRIRKAVDLEKGAELPEEPPISPLKEKGSMMWRDEH